MENFKSLICAWTCSDNQDQFLQIENATSTIYNFTVYVSDHFTQSFWDSCKDACYNFPIGTLLNYSLSDLYFLGKKGSVQQMFGSYGDAAPIHFMDAFNSNNDPFYTLDHTHPYLSYAPTVLDPQTENWLDVSVVPELKV
jgi:hypothetical protein